MELFDYLQANMILAAFIGICLLTFLIRLPHLCTVKDFTYSYSAKTRYGMQEHNYNLSVRRVSGGYRCYIERTPSFVAETHHTICLTTGKKSTQTDILSARQVQ